ncbi:helix-turn-helix transcriptional regulator [Thermogemmatispora sp.]|uniref:helix-turn-helix transcriptional regulator n=1 Tax=Thermogemmatispora sp. TaxID=1968838 RepID=UPI001DB96F94|nr:helix-turn-helix transcriptional regulator [Thermogemmatispora sp.]MBX5449925.1 AAA family ATPase [Thermogemmatispora sp.]
MEEHRFFHEATTLVGRERELAWLRSLEEKSRTGCLQVALIAGEPGIGKTRLLRELARWARQQGTTVLQGGASGAEGMPPYLPFLEALGQHIRNASMDALRLQAGAMTSVLATILPELSLRLGESTSSYPLPPEQARLRLFEAVGLFLNAIATSQPLLLVLDDLHWSDQASLDLLCHVAQHQPTARLLILGAYREGEVMHRNAFERALSELERLRLLTMICLKPLTAEAVAELASGYLGAAVDPAVSRLLAAQSEGNPFLAEELLRGWLESGVIAQQQDGTTYGLVASNPSLLPSSILSAVRLRLAHLAPATVELLRSAALIGRTFDAALLGSVAGQDEERVEEWLEEAVQARLIDQLPTTSVAAPSHFAFSHDMIRECLAREVRATRRHRLHTLIGQALEQRLARSNAIASAQQLAELAFHFARSGDPESGAAYARRAARQALQTYAPAEALAHERTALQLLSLNDPRRGPWLLELGTAALLAAAWSEAIDAFQRAQEWGRCHGDQHLAGCAALGLGRAYWRQERIAPARIALEEAVTALSSQTTPDTVEALVELGSLLVLSLHQQEEALTCLERALALARQLGERRLEAASCRALGNLLARSNQLQRGLPLLEQALSLALSLGEALEVAECCACLTMAYGWYGELDRRAQLFPLWLEYAGRCHDPYQLRHLYTHLASSYALRSQWSETDEALDRSQALVEQLASPEPAALLQWTRGLLLAPRGHLTEAEDLITTALAWYRQHAFQSLAWWLGGLGFVQAIQGKEQEARACLAELEALVNPLPAESMPLAHALCFMAAISAVLADQTWAARLYPRLLPFRGQFHSFSVDRLLGTLAVLTGDLAAATDHLARAEAVARRFGLGFELASTLGTRALLVLARDGSPGMAQARALLEEAVALSQSTGNSALAQLLQRQWQELVCHREQATSLSRPTSLPLPAGLSRREAQVLRLVAQGKSNRQIAAILVISERTVANHVRNIFNKTGVDNRAAAAVFAIRQGLLD